MAAKPMSRIQTGLSGNPIVNIAGRKRSLPSPERSKARENFRSSNRTLSSHLHQQEPSLSESSEHPQNDIRTDDCMQTIILAPASSHSQLPDELEYQHIASCSDEPVAKKQLYSVESVIHMTVDGAQSSSSNHSMENINAEHLRLKELTMLQVSLISRQQDLLKLRDKEIMRLKASNQSYKSRLERMERRISLSQRQSGNKSVSTRLHENEGDLVLVVKEAEPEIELKSNDEHFKSKGKESSAGLSKSSWIQKVEELTTNNSLNKDTPKSNINHILKSPVKPLNDSSCIPVPVSYIQRCQNQLYSGSTTSPTAPSKAMNLLPPSVIDESINSKVALKVCDHCANCVAVAAEIRSILSIANNVDHKEECLGLKPDALSGGADASMFSVAGLIPCKKEGNPSDEILRTKYPYYQHVWISEPNSTCTTEFENSDGKYLLNVPTWKVNKMIAEPILEDHDKTHKEDIDDETYFKRHNKFETAEKRRKRWDFQRIREYRYNEKLRNKLLKPEENFEFIETYSPSIQNVTSIEVQDSLPVNVFGESLIDITPEEFSIENL